MPYYYRRYGGYRNFRRYYRRYGSRYTSVKKLTTSPNVKASAQNMTQGGKFTVTSHKVVALGKVSSGDWGATAAFVAGDSITYSICKLKLAALIKSSEMHAALSNVFDQYRIDKVIIKVRDAGQSTDSGDLSALVLLPTLSSIVDRTGVTGALDIAKMKSYSSYKETQLAQNGDVSPVHTIYVGASTIVESSTYFDSKQVADFAECYLAVAFPTGDALTDYTNYARNLSVDIEAQIRYRGVRLDSS